MLAKDAAREESPWEPLNSASSVIRGFSWRVHKVRGLGKSQKLRVWVPQNLALDPKTRSKSGPAIEQRSLSNSGCPGLRSQIMRDLG